jgi:hypothetical protein
MVDPLKLGMELARLAVDLFDGRETPAGARMRVKDILPDESESEKAAEDIIRAKRLEALGELDDVGTDEDESTWPGQPR